MFVKLDHLLYSNLGQNILVLWPLSLNSLPHFGDWVLLYIPGWSRTHYLDENDLKLFIVLPPLPKFWDHRCAPPSLAKMQPGLFLNGPPALFSLVFACWHGPPQLAQKTPKGDTPLS